MPVTSRSAALQAVLLLTVLDVAMSQVAPQVTVVAVRDPSGAPATRLLAVDTLGAATAFGSFAADSLPPLAICIDPYDRQLIVAVELGSISRLLRLQPTGLTITQEVVLGDLPGPCTQLAVLDDRVYAVVGGNAGGVFRLPRNGGQPVQTVVRANAASIATFAFGSLGLLAWSGTTTPIASDPGLQAFDFATGQAMAGAYLWSGFQPQEIVGLADLPTGASRQLLAFPNGTFAVHLAGAGNPTPFAVSPAVPSGGVVALKSEGGSGVATGLGGSAYPFLYHIDTITGARTTVSNALPGEPVDFALPLAPFPQQLTFGSDCGGTAPPTLVLGVGGPPQLGNASFDVRMAGATPAQLVVFFAGFADVLPGLLPFALPGGCELRVQPEVGTLQIANVGGGAQQALPIPNQPSLAGQVVFAQWLEVQGAVFATTQAVAIALGP